MFPRINLEAVIALLSSAVAQAPQLCCAARSADYSGQWGHRLADRASYFFTLDPSPDNMRRVGLAAVAVVFVIAWHYPMLKNVSQRWRSVLPSCG